MAWITPVTNRKNEKTRTTASDFNRICGNANIAFGTALKTDWTVNDIVDATTWNALIEAARSVDNSITNSSHYKNLNKIEYAILLGNGGTKPSDELYPSDDLLP